MLQQPFDHLPWQSRGLYVESVSSPGQKIGEALTPEWAQLFAAAPELLATIKPLLDAYLSIHNGEETAIAARALAAIAKAEGR